MTEAKLDLIAKLLAKAESTTPEEAEALTEHAARLMVKYGIDQARIDERRARGGHPPEEIVQERMVFTGAYARDLRDLGGAVAHAVGTIRPLQAELAGVGSILILVGYASDVRQAQVLIGSLRIQAMVAMRAWWDAARVAYEWHTESERRRARSGFVRGFGGGAAARIAENRNAVVEEAGSGTDLVLASRRQRVDAFVDGMPIRRARRRSGADAGAYVSGHRSGRQANTGEAAIRERRSLPQG